MQDAQPHPPQRTRGPGPWVWALCGFLVVAVMMAPLLGLIAAAVSSSGGRHGGGVAHHHGSGRLRKNYLHHDLGESGVTLLRTLKKAIDPHGLMNPGNLIPDE